MASLCRASAKRYRSTVEGRSRVAQSVRNAIRLDVFLQPVQVAADEGRAIPRNHFSLPDILTRCATPLTKPGISAGDFILLPK